MTGVGRFLAGHATATLVPTMLRAEKKTPRGTVPLAAVRTDKSNYLDVHRQFRGGSMNTIVAM